MVLEEEATDLTQSPYAVTLPETTIHSKKAGWEASLETGGGNFSGDPPCDGCDREKFKSPRVTIFPEFFSTPDRFMVQHIPPLPSSKYGKFCASLSYELHAALFIHGRQKEVIRQVTRD